MAFLNFTGEETEVEFLERCYKHWASVTGGFDTDTRKLVRLTPIFTEMRHRIEELGGDYR